MKQFNFFKQLFTLLAFVVLSTQAWGYATSGSAVKQVGSTYYVLYETAESNFSTISSKEYELKGPGAQLYYEAKCVPILGFYDGDLKAAQKIGDDWSGALFSEQPPKNSYKKYGPVGIEYKATHIKLYTEVGATGRKYFQNVFVTMAQYIEDVSASSLNFGSGKVDAADSKNSVTVNWCNVPALSYSISGADKDQFSVSVSSNASAGKWGVATFTVSYKHNKAGAHSAKLVITDSFGDYIQEVTLSGTTQKNANAITWNPDVTTWKDWGEQLDLDATSSNPDLENSPIVYAISNEEYATMENGVVTFLEAGAGKEVTITVTQQEDWKYLGATVTKTFHILRGQSVAWDQTVLNNIVRLGATRDISAYAVATPAGSRAITYASSDENVIAVHEDGVTIEALALGQATITANLAGDAEYKPASISKEFEVLEKEIAVLYLGDLILNDNDEINLYIGENSGAVHSTNTSSAITCAIANESVVVFNSETQKLESRGLGSTTVTLTQAANEDYPEAVRHLTVNVIRYQTAITASIESANLFVGEEAAIELTTNRESEDIVCESSNEAVAKYENGVIKAIGAGNANIFFRQPETDSWSAGELKVPVTVSRKASSLTVKMNGTAQTSISVYQSERVNITFDKVSDAEVVVEQTGGQMFAYYSNGVLQASNEIGTAYFRATLPQTDMYEGKSVEFSMTVQKDNRHLPVTMSNSLWNNSNFKVSSEGTTSWDNSKGITLGDASGGGFNWDDKSVVLHFEGIPDKLTFEIATDAIGIGQSLGGVTNAEWYIQEGKTSSLSETKIWTSSSTSTTFAAQSVQLDPTTRYVKLCYSGNFAGCFRNVKISELKYVQDPEPASVDFGTAIIYSGEVEKEVNINWCNVAQLTVTNTDPRFTVTPAYFANYDEFGSQTLKISYNHSAEIGTFKDTIVISNGEDTYTKRIPVVASTTKRPQPVTWNAELAATGFAMNVGEIYPDATIGAIATTPNGELITYTSSDPDVIEVVFDTILVAKAVGTAEITAYQAGDAEYEEASDTKTFTVSELLKQTITWEQNLYGLLTTSGSVELTATATSGGEIIYESADETVVKVEGSILTVVGEGETYITATQAGGEIDEQEWLPVSAVNYVIVRNPASQCNEMALSVGTLTLSSGMLSKEYVLEGTPTTLTFSALHGTKPNGAWGQKPTYAALMVDQYSKVDGAWGWHTIYNNVVGTDATASGSITLSETATKLRFRTTETGTEHTISNIRVPRAKYMRADVSAFDETAERNAVWTKTITVSHSNIDLMTVTAKADILTVSTTTLGTGCGDFGDSELTVSFTPKEKDVEYLDTIVISDGKAQPSTIEIPVRLFTTSLNQAILGFELPATCAVTDEVPAFEATASSGLEVTYSTSDESIASIVNGNQLKLHAAGTVEVTAYQAGNDRYNEASVTKTIVITKAPTTVNVLPTASDLFYGQTLEESTLTGGQASVSGVFTWLNPETMPATGTHAYAVLFTPYKDTYYDTAMVNVEVYVGKVAQTITWSESIYPVTVLETLELNARSSVDLEITYTSSNNEIAYMEGNVLHAVSAGTVTITASQAGDDNYLAAEAVAREIQIIDIVRITPVVSAPTATAIIYGQPLSESTLQGGEAYIPETEQVLAGQFVWADSTLVLNAGTHDVNVVFVPEDQTYYNTLTFPIELTVNKASQEIEWVTEVDTLIIDDYKDIDVSATSGLTVTLISEDPEIVEVMANSHTIHALAEGSVYIIAKQDGDDNYLAAEQVSRAVVVRAEVTEEPTALDNADAENAKWTKIVRDGHIYLLRGNRIYTISGLRVE